MGPGFFYYHRGPDGPQIRRALLLLAISGLLAFALYAGAQMRPLLGSLATTRVSNAVNRIVYQAVNEAIDSGQIAYEQLVSYEKDNEGRITMVRRNMAAFNRLQSQILDLILGRIDQVSATHCYMYRVSEPDSKPFTFALKESCLPQMLLPRECIATIRTTIEDCHRQIPCC